MKKHIITILISVFSFYLSAQISQGEYFSYGRNSSGEKIEILKNNHFRFIINSDTIGGYGTLKNGKVIASKLVVDESTTPMNIDVVFYDKETNKELKKVLGIIKIKDQNNFILHLNYNGSGGRPKEFNEKFPGTISYIKNSDDNYIELLKNNERKKILGFYPKVDTTIVSPHVKEFRYFHNGNLLITKNFQSKERVSFDKNGNILKKEYLTSKNKPFINQFGFSIQINEYDSNNRVTKKSLFVKDGKLIKGNVEFDPITETIYNQNERVEIKRLISNKNLLKIKAARTVFLFDKYGDQIGWEEYYADGSLIEDTLKFKLIEQLNIWINANSEFPNSYKLLKAGKPSFSFTFNTKEYDKKKKTGKYSIYVEFELKSKNNQMKLFTGFLQFNNEYEIFRIAFKEKKTGTGSNNSWGSLDYEKWFATWGKKKS